MKAATAIMAPAALYPGALAPLGEIGGILGPPVPAVVNGTDEAGADELAEPEALGAGVIRGLLLTGVLLWLHFAVYVVYSVAIEDFEAVHLIFIVEVAVALMAVGLAPGP